MKKIILLLVVSLCFPLAHASKLSKFLNKLDAEEQAQRQREWREDMNFNDLSFRLERRFGDQFGQQCREYEFRSRSNPYRHGHYTVCEERGRSHDHGHQSQGPAGSHAHGHF
ncbi:hypothetical protein [Legionella londiniensis]|uniref:DUF1104 domain-containing protein n=1 Tax=Legionella londiniensis TaxID=45068 RepID=A0A0W0VHE1_9GAMM|nr:hypothetical protein Llon_2119 [Legionella londiniensis]STX92240.1 Uncharacterised protein [Legionella londiniensis]